jgi:hypothetical protein
MATSNYSKIYDEAFRKMFEEISKEFDESIKTMTSSSNWFEGWVNFSRPKISIEEAICKWRAERENKLNDYVARISR